MTYLICILILDKSKQKQQEGNIMKKLIVIMALSISVASFAQNIPEKNPMEQQKKAMQSQQQQLTKSQELEYEKLQVDYSQEQEKFKLQIQKINKEIEKEKSSRKINKKKIEKLERKNLAIKADMEKNQIKYRMEIKTKYHIYN